MPIRPGLVAVLSALLAACAPAAGPEGPSSGFRHLDAEASRIVTRHDIRLAVSAGRGFQATPVSNRVADFDGHPFEVSLAALLGEGEAVMVHAERVADSSGRSNYDDLPRSGWPDARFGVRTMCVTIDRPAIEEEHDLAFLARNGWSPEGSLAIAQYLASTVDHNQEVVISLLVRVPGCGDAAVVEEALARLRGRVRVDSEATPDPGQGRSANESKTSWASAAATGRRTSSEKPARAPQLA